MKHQILALAVAALSFTACTNEDNISQDYLADTPIKLNVSVDEPTTRAGYSDADKPRGLYSRSYMTSIDTTNTIIWFGQKRLEIAGKPINPMRHLRVELTRRSPCYGQTRMTKLT